MELFQLSLIIAYCCIICLHLLTIDAISYSKIAIERAFYTEKGMSADDTP